ncbi:hypothetical protein [Nodularia sphaerocarpa]|uniref:hypothetical protein n=1 Tax=Nodularia sphaerocarpa TaxID=137816 RepID=UPI001EFBFCBE|nr:hypothetical protein [Nodularia sphaerocarpa]
MTANSNVYALKFQVNANAEILTILKCFPVDFKFLLLSGMLYLSAPSFSFDIYSFAFADHII